MLAGPASPNGKRPAVHERPVEIRRGLDELVERGERDGGDLGHRMQPEHATEGLAGSFLVRRTHQQPAPPGLDGGPDPGSIEGGPDVPAQHPKEPPSRP
jgi:hypothetical protein